MTDQPDSPSPFTATINDLLRPKRDGKLPLVVDLFAGCGGLSLGFEAQGFLTLGFEKDADCCETYRANLNGECIETFLTPDTELPNCKVVIGGPPCQPFSVGGNQMGLKDSRDGFPAFLSAVKRLQPDLWLFENVRGLYYRNKWYLAEILQELRGMGYLVEHKLLNAKHHGVPQNRERVIVVGHRGSFSFPERQTTRVTAGEALGDMAFEVPSDSKFLTASMDKYVLKYEIASKCVNPRDLHLDRPSRTVTCRNLAGATGDMHRVRLKDGRRRRLRVREGARIQSFPDWFVFHGREHSQFNQVGNAVAPLFAFELAAQVRAYFEAGGATLSRAEIDEINGRQRGMSADGQFSLL